MENAKLVEAQFSRDWKTTANRPGTVPTSSYFFDNLTHVEWPRGGYVDLDEDFNMRHESAKAVLII